MITKAMLQLLLILNVLSQREPFVCSVLPANTLCGPGFAGYPIPRLAQDFNRNLETYIKSFKGLSDQLLSNNTCNQNVVEKVETFRYMVTQQCVYGVLEAINKSCSFSPGSNVQMNPLGPSMCRDECEIGRTSVDLVYNDKDICPNRIYNTGFNTVCRFSNSDANCIKYVPSESFCGFNNQEVAEKQCKSIQDDVCCIELFESKGSFGITANQNTNLIIGIVSGCVLLTTLSGYIFYRRNYLQTDRSITGMDKASKNQDIEKFQVNNNGTSNPVLQQTQFEVKITPNSIQNKKDIESLDRPRTYFRTSMTFSAYESEHPALTQEVLLEYPPRTVIVKACFDYFPNLPDELAFTKDQEFLMLKAFDDGWALGYNHFTDEQGAFPISRVIFKYQNNKQTRFASGISTNTALSKRTSSMHVKSFMESLKRPKVPFQDYLNQLED